MPAARTFECAPQAPSGRYGFSILHQTEVKAPEANRKTLGIAESNAQSRHRFERWNPSQLAQMVLGQMDILSQRLPSPSKAAPCPGPYFLENDRLVSG